jgi:hypothetical protein
MYERNTGDSTMNERKTADSPVGKKLWTEPVIKTIALGTARHETQINNDGGGTHTHHVS